MKLKQVVITAGIALAAVFGVKVYEAKTGKKL